MKSNKFYIFFILFIFIPVSIFSQENFTILCAAAHPDDEDGSTLAYYSKLKGYNAYTIFYTRGEGGQNEIGPELDSALGVIREQECKNAAKIQGSTPLFLGELDFGFSKTAKETFKFWGGKDSVLARIVYMIRVIRPDVIITNHDTITTKPKRQHGNHQAVGITIYEAFDKAADPSFHPEQLVNGITPWQVKKLYFRVFDSTQTNGFVTIDINKKDSSGKTIDEIAWEALAMHKTQGMDKINRNDIPIVFRERKYELVRSDKDYPYDPADLFSGLTPTSKLSIQPQSYPTVYHYDIKNNIDSVRVYLNKFRGEAPKIHVLLSYLDTNKLIQGHPLIGIISTYDNTLQDFFNDLKIKYSFIDSLMFTSRSLNNFDVIIIDLRAYLYRKDLLLYNDTLLNYVHNGGNVICFYNKPSDWDIGKNLSPYPIYITNERVTEEDAAVQILDPHHRYFNVPFEVVPEDWKGWVQERNIYLPSDDTTLTCSKYKRLLAMQDEDDLVPSTSLLYANYGIGTYTYCCLALYRQLKILNPGAVKLFLNMIYEWNKDHNPIFKSE